MAFPFVVLNKLAANAVITKPNYLCDGFREFLFQSLDSQIISKIDSAIPTVVRHF